LPADRGRKGIDTVFTPNVVALRVVSLLTDFSSEMIYPLLPLFLTRVLGAELAFVGLIEGVAESTASFVKLVSGWFSDRVGRRKGLVLGGYALSSCAWPLVAAAASSPWAGCCTPACTRDSPRSPGRRPCGRSCWPTGSTTD